MFSTIAAVLLSTCFPGLSPTAEMVRDQHGKPDTFNVHKCGGGSDEFGKKVKPWKCLGWSYDDKGTIFFGQDDALGENPYVITGCSIREPVITKHDGPVWFVNACFNPAGKEVACNTIGLGVDETDDFKGPDFTDALGKIDQAAVAEWARSQVKFCTTKAEAQKVARACSAPEKQQKDEVQPATRIAPNGSKDL